MTNQEFTDSIRNIIRDSHGNLDKSFTELMGFAKAANKSLYDEVLVLKSRYDGNKRDYNLGKLESGKYRMEITGITDSILSHILKKIENLPDVLTRIKERRPGLSVKTIYVSYSFKSDDDTKLAKYIQRLLEKQGKRIFSFDENIDIDSGWTAKLEEALSACDYYILILSQEYMINEMVAEEIKRLRNRNDEPTIIPIRLKMPSGQELPYDLKQTEQNQPFMWNTEQDNDMLEFYLSKIIDESIGFKPIITSGEKISIKPNLPVSSANPGVGNNILNSKYYIEREADKKCNQIISNNYAILRIKAPKQYGKTTLLSRLVLQARDMNYSAVTIDFQMFTESNLSDLEQLLKLICNETTEQLRLENKLDEYWAAGTSHPLKAYKYFDRYILLKHEKPILFAIDKADKLFKHQGQTAEFFGMLRSWHQTAINEDKDHWKRFCMVITYSTDDIPIEDLNGSFFNVGDEIPLKEFSKENVLTLAKAHGMEWTFEMAETLHKLVGGHPYLVRKAMYELSSRNYSFSDMLEAAASDDGPFGDHLSRCFFKISKSENLGRLITLKEIIETGKSSNHQECAYLKAIGLIQTMPNRYILTSDLYLNYFRKKLTPPSSPPQKSWINFLIDMFK